MSVKMKFGSKDIPFVYKGDKLVYPNPIKDGLLLWYDFKGMRNTDTNKEVAKDLSGNGNDGTLTNFNFTEESGYKDNTLVFDGVDDKLVIPELDLDETAMSVMHDGKLYAYEDDKVLTIGEDGEITNIPKNILVGSDLSEVRPRSTITSLSSYSKGDEIIVRSEKIESDGTTTVFGFENKPNETSFIEGEDITLSFEARGNVGLNYVFLMRPSGGNINLYFNTSEMNEQEFKRFSVTTKAPFTTDSSNILVATTQGLGGEAWFEVKNPKLEKGVNTTQWIRNPKDYQTTNLSPASLTDLQLYNKTLRKDELLHNAESKGLKQLKPGVVVQDGLVLHYDFSHESNTSEYKDKAFDYSGNGNHGELQNFNFTGESGYVGNKLKFDGVDDYILSNSLDRDYIDPIKNFNFDFVLNQKDITSKGTVILMPLTSQRLTVKNSENTIAVGRYTSHWFGRKTPPLKRGINHFSINVILLGEGEYELNEPSFLIEMYVNGTLVEDVYASSSDYYSNVASVLTIGWQGTDASQNDNAYLNESLHSLKIYNRQLTPEEIAHNYAIEKEKFNIVEGEI